VPRARYHPSSAHNDFGNTVFTAGSWVEFRCLTKIKDVDASGLPVFSGTMLFNNRINITWEVR
jgi:hypothetical protein